MIDLWRHGRSLFLLLRLLGDNQARQRLVGSKIHCTWEASKHTRMWYKYNRRWNEWLFAETGILQVDHKCHLTFILRHCRLQDLARHVAFIWNWMEHLRENLNLVTNFNLRFFLTNSISDYSPSPLHQFESANFCSFNSKRYKIAQTST